MSLKINWQPGEWDSASTDQRDLAGAEEKRRNYSWHYLLAPAVRARPAAAACKVVGEHLTLEIYYQHQPSSFPVSISTHSNCGWSQTLSLLDLECGSDVSEVSVRMSVRLRKFKIGWEYHQTIVRVQNKTEGDTEAWSTLLNDLLSYSVMRIIQGVTGCPDDIVC